MKKFFEVIGFVTFVVFSFFYTEKTIDVVKNIDDIMKKIEVEQSKYYEEPIDATINDNTIIPGISGREVDIDESYNEMKRLGKYSSNLLKYNIIKPKVSLSNNYNKYVVGGNPKNKKVSLIFKTNNDYNIKNIVSILNDNNVSANFLISNNWFKNNNDLLITFIKSSHVIIIDSDDYNDIKFENSIITKIGKQKMSFCYSEKPKDTLLNECSINKNITVIPNYIISDNPYINIKKKIKTGNIIAININDNTINELPIIIKYIRSKDISLVNLIDLLDE